MSGPVIGIAPLPVIERVHAPAMFPKLRLRDRTLQIAAALPGPAAGPRFPTGGRLRLRTGPLRW